jgi:mRNA interferase YafQ
MANKKKYDIKATAQFKKDYKLAKKRGLDIKLLAKVINTLAEGENLPVKYKDHALKGKWSGRRECHVLPNWLLVYQKTETTLVLDLFRTGTHSDIFGNE